jgi:hypothetical protein
MGNQFWLVPIPGWRKHLETRPLSVGCTCMSFFCGASWDRTEYGRADRYQRGLGLSDRLSDRVADREALLRATLGAMMVGGIRPVCTPTLCAGCVQYVQDRTAASSTVQWLAEAEAVHTYPSIPLCAHDRRCSQAIREPPHRYSRQQDHTLDAMGHQRRTRQAGLAPFADAVSLRTI